MPFEEGVCRSDYEEQGAHPEFHEAGHAVAAYLFGRGFRHVSVRPEKELVADIRLTYKLTHDRPSVRMEQNVIIALAGPAAEMVCTGGEGMLACWDTDRVEKSICDAYARDDVDPGVSEDIAVRYTWYMWARTRMLLLSGMHWAAVDALADALGEKTELTESQARRIIKEAIAGTRSPYAG